MRKSKPKPVRAWALANKKFQVIHPHWLFATKRDAEMRLGLGWVPQRGDDEYWLRVEIRPIADKRRKKNTRRTPRRASKQ